VRGAFVSWVPFSGRSQAFIDEFGLAPIYVSYLKTEQPLMAPLKYGPQLLTTLRRLAETRPELVFVMDPPPFATAAVFLHCLRSKARYVMDCHSGVFEGNRWRWSLPLQRFFGRRAAAVIVTNPADAAAASSWPANAIIMGDPPPVAASVPDDTVPLRSGANKPPLVFVIVRFGKDEAIEQTLEAARRLPNVRFLVSGDARRARPEWLTGHPANVRFTGWLRHTEFLRYVRVANAVLTLTTQENAILQGGWEAMFMGQPLITSNSPVLRWYFGQGAVFVDNTARGIAAGVDQALAREDELRREMRGLRAEKARGWRNERQQLERLLGAEFPVHAAAETAQSH
jgi:glycosyltransferase involved in cell wall biosynthesis